MALLDIEGFEDLANSTYLAAAAWYSGGTLSAVTGRSGARSALNLTGNPCYWARYNYTTDAHYFVGFGFKRDHANSSRIMFVGTDTGDFCLNLNTSAALKINTGNSALAGSVLATGNANDVPINTWVYIELECYRHASLGYLKIYVNDALMLTYNGNTTAGGGIAWQTVELDGEAASGNQSYDDLYIADGSGANNNARFGSGTVVQPLLPTGAGSTTQFTPSTGSNYACVNETTPDGDSTYVSSSTVGQIDTYAMADLTGISNVRGVSVSPIARKDDVATRQLFCALRSGGANYFGDGWQSALGSSYYMTRFLWETDPATGSLWDNTSVNALEAGFKVNA